MPVESNFAFREVSLPLLNHDEVLLRILYLSVDPYMRGRMNANKSYIPPFELDKPITGGAIGQVIESKSSKFTVGDTVLGFLDWSDYSIAPAKGLQKIDTSIAPVSTALGVLGMPGLTAYFGLMTIGHPKAGETVVVSGAAGAVGMTAGQIARIHGCRVIGIAGSDEKTKFLTDVLKFDGAVNYKTQPVKETLKALCPNGVDIYFDNVGGTITDAVFTMINKKARIVLCGQIDLYNLDKPTMGPRHLWRLITHSAKAEGFIVSDFESRYGEGITNLVRWLKNNNLFYRENIIEGLENVPKALLGLFTGENLGKQLVKIAI